MKLSGSNVPVCSSVQSTLWAASLSHFSLKGLIWWASTVANILVTSTSYSTNSKILEYPFKVLLSTFTLIA